MVFLVMRIQNWLRRQEGQALSEYGLVIALVAVAAIGALIAFREELGNTLRAITEAMSKTH